MLLVKTKVDKSPIHGLGLYAAEFIPAGTTIWEFAGGFDLRIIKLESVPAPLREFIQTYGFKSDRTGWILSCDNDKYTNHSHNPNTILGPRSIGSIERTVVAKRDILSGEEITTDYSSIGIAH